MAGMSGCWYFELACEFETDLAERVSWYHLHLFFWTMGMDAIPLALMGAPTTTDLYVERSVSTSPFTMRWRGAVSGLHMARAHHHHQVKYWQCDRQRPEKS